MRLIIRYNTFISSELIYNAKVNFMRIDLCVEWRKNYTIFVYIIFSYIDIYHQ